MSLNFNLHSRILISENIVSENELHIISSPIMVTTLNNLRKIWKIWPAINIGKTTLSISLSHTHTQIIEYVDKENIKKQSMFTLHLNIVLYFYPLLI